MHHLKFHIIESKSNINMRLSWDKALLMSMQIIQLSDEFKPSPVNFGTDRKIQYIC